MNSLWAPWLDRLLLFQLHRKRSSSSQFFHVSSSPSTADLSGLQAFYATPRIPDIQFEQQNRLADYDIGRFSFDSEVKSDDQNNDVSTGWAYTHSTHKSKEHIVFVHGWRMDRLNRIKDLFLDSFMKRNADMYFFTLPYHFDRAPASSMYGGEFFVSAHIDRTLLAIKQAVTDLRALIRWIKERKGGQVVLIGISLGGFITNLTSLVEEQINLLISVMYANRIAYSVWKTIPGKYIRTDLVQHGITYDQLEASWAITEPSRFQPVIPKDRILLLSGKYDRYVMEEDTAFLWESWGKPQRIVYPCGHAGIALKKRQIAEDVSSFLASRLPQ